MDLHIQPNYDDFSCQWKFNTTPPLYEDAAVMVPRFAARDSEYKGEKDAFRQRVRVQTGVGIATAWTHTRARRSNRSPRARAKKPNETPLAARTPTAPPPTPPPSRRADDVTSGGKCWSVDERREVMGDVRES